MYYLPFEVLTLDEDRAAQATLSDSVDAGGEEKSRNADKFENECYEKNSAEVAGQKLIEAEKAATGSVSPCML